MEHKWEKCVDYCRKAVISGEADPNVAVLKHLADKNDLSKTERAWISILYSTCYCASTTWFLFTTLPPLNKLRGSELQVYWDEVARNLIFQSDRKYVKNMNWFVPIIKSYRKIVGSDHAKILGVIGTKEQDSIFSLITSLKYCGRFSAFLYIDCVQELFDIEIKINPKNWNDWATAGEGLCHAIDRDDLAEAHHLRGTYPRYAYPMLDKAFDKLKREICEVATITDSQLETALCAYRKLFKQSRYYGYYVDRQLEEFEKNRSVFELNGYEDLLEDLYEARKSCIDNSLLGEINGWKTLRKELNKIFMETGGNLE